jgi:6-pyruvoyltetrahydropterin/6-carboxytetrahydropterin synthase
MEIYKNFTFDAAHKLTCVPDGHKCANLHGHTFKVEVHLAGEEDKARGWVVDFNDVKAAVSPILEQLDHGYLNDIKGLENPTSENIARWLWPKLKEKLPMLSKIVVKESPSSGAVYKGE